MTIPTRPDDSMQCLFSALEPVSSEIKVIPRKRMSWEYKGKPQLYLFMEGEISLVRVTDGLVVASAYDPHIFGLGEAIQPKRYHILRVEKKSRILAVDVENALKIFDEQNLWRDVSTTLAYFNAYLVYRDEMVLQQRTYSVIRSHLQEMIGLPLEARLNTSILDYIRLRTHLSRSSILNVIFVLKTEKRIEIKRGGFLVAINNLPEKI